MQHSQCWGKSSGWGLQENIVLPLRMGKPQYKRRLWSGFWKMNSLQRRRNWRFKLPHANSLKTQSSNITESFLLNAEYLVWLFEYSVVDRTYWVDSPKGSSEFPWSYELQWWEGSALSWKKRILGVNRVWDCFHRKVCSCLSQLHSTATSKHFLLFLACFLGTCLQLWKDEDSFLQS